MTIGKSEQDRNLGGLSVSVLARCTRSYIEGYKARQSTTRTRGLLESKLEQRIAQVETKLSQCITQVETKLGHR